MWLCPYCFICSVIATPISNSTLKCGDLLYREMCIWQKTSVMALVSNYIKTTGATSRAGTALPSGAPAFTPGFYWGSCCSIFSFMCMFCFICSVIATPISNSTLKCGDLLYREMCIWLNMQAFRIWWPRIFWTYCMLLTHFTKKSLKIPV
jgi:hypothetical protein